MWHLFVLLISNIVFLSAGLAQTNDPIGDAESRVNSRSFPSVFLAWSDGSGDGNDKSISGARHDLIFVGAGEFGLGRLDQGEKLPKSVVAAALEKRSRLQSC